MISWVPVSLIALILIVFNTGGIANSEMKTGVTEITISMLFIRLTFLLFLITLANLAIRKFGGAPLSLTNCRHLSGRTAWEAGCAGWSAH